MRGFTIVSVFLMFFSCSTPAPTEAEDQTFQAISEKVIARFPDGQVKIVEYIEENQLHEQRTVFKEYWPTGKIKIVGELDSNGKRDGLWKSYYENGNPWSEGMYEHGLENGRTTAWYENGKKRYEGETINGKPTGKWLFWDEKGISTEKSY
jgi:antitoxin component YwqK of YwqJK toxin-antitoxin module